MRPCDRLSMAMSLVLGLHFTSRVPVHTFAPQGWLGKLSPAHLPAPLFRSFHADVCSACVKCVLIQGRTCGKLFSIRRMTLLERPTQAVGWAAKTVMSDDVVVASPLSLWYVVPLGGARAGRQGSRSMQMFVFACGSVAWCSLKPPCHCSCQVLSFGWCSWR